jgi:hypothetical protein
MAQTSQVLPGGRYGILSVWLALGAFSAAMTAMMVTLLTSKSTGAVYGVVSPIFVVIFGLMAPLAHIVGLGLGVGAILRRNDRRGLGILGVCLNGLAIGIGVLLVYASLSGLGPFR